MARLATPFDPAQVTRPCSFSNLPDIPAIQRLKGRRQWVCWRYEDRGGPKPTKVPYQPRTGFKASVAKSTDWSSYADAVSRAERGRFDGIGYVLSGDDDLTGVDLDHCRDPETGDLDPLAQHIVDLAESYCEVTPSETGLRLFVEGKVAEALKCDPVGVEVYGAGRYLTITGWHLPGSPAEILSAPLTMDALRAAKAEHDAKNTAAPAATNGAAGFAPPLSPASEGGSPFFRNVNSAALASLHAWVPAIFGAAARFHPGTGAFRVSSKALGRNLEEDLSIAPNGIRDWGVGDMGDPRGGARTPIDLVMLFGFETVAKDAALWLCNQIGKDPAALGWMEDDGRGAEIAANLLARRVVSTEAGDLMDAETGEIIEATPIAVSPAQDYPDEALQVGGLVGEMADWIMATAMYPCRLFAVAAALAAIGTVVGRQVYTGVPRAGTSLYWLTIAPTAGGKDRPQEAIKQMFAAADLGHLIKPAVSSAAKLGMSLQERPVQMQVIDEVGKVLRKFVSRNSSAQEMSLLDDYCSIWGKNLGSFEPEGVTTRTDVSIKRPSLTFYGATTPSAFYTQLRAGQVAGGFLNRFLVMQRHERVTANPNVQPEDTVPPRIVTALRTLRTFQDRNVLPSPSIMADDPTMPPTPFVVPVSDAAEVLLQEARDRAWQMILASDNDPILEVHARAAEMVKRMALVLACGRHWQNMERCRIEAADVTFAANLVDWSMASFVEGLRTHMAENEHQANTKMVVAIVRKAGKIARNDLVRRVDGKLDARMLDGVLKMAVEGGEIDELREDSGTKGGRPKTSYLYRGTGHL